MLANIAAVPKAMAPAPTIPTSIESEDEILSSVSDVLVSNKLKLCLLLRCLEGAATCWREPEKVDGPCPKVEESIEFVTKAVESVISDKLIINKYEIIFLGGPVAVVVSISMN